MCNKVILVNGGTLKSVLDFYKNKKMCNKAIDNYAHSLVPNCHKTQKMCDEVSTLTMLQYNLYLNAITLKKYVSKLSFFILLCS